MFIALDKESAAIAVGRCLAGFAHGIIYNAVITHASENVMKEIRGMLLSTVNTVMFSGVFVAATLSATVTNRYDYYNEELSADAIVGIFGLVVTVLGIICNIFLTYESIPYLLRRDNNAEATVNMLKLRSESVMTTELTNELDEMKLMVTQDKQHNQNILSNGNASAIGKMIVLRIVSTLTNNFFLNYTLISITTILLPFESYYLAPLILATPRFVASFIPIVSTDFIKRKLHLTGSGFISGILMLIIAIIIASINEYQLSTTWVLAALCIAFQFFVALGIDPMQHVLLSEAFSTSKKAWSIAVVTSAEYLLQIMFIGVFFSGPGAIYRIGLMVLLFITAGLILVFVLLLQSAIPETFKTSLREARDLFCR